MKPDDEAPDANQDEPTAGPDFLVGEKTDDVKPTGVDDESTGQEGDDFLGETNRKNRDDESDSRFV